MRAFGRPRQWLAADALGVCHAYVRGDFARGRRIAEIYGRAAQSVYPISRYTGFELKNVALNICNGWRACAPLSGGLSGGGAMRPSRDTAARAQLGGYAEHRNARVSRDERCLCPRIKLVTL